MHSVCSPKDFCASAVCPRDCGSRTCAQGSKKLGVPKFSPTLPSPPPPVRPSPAGPGLNRTQPDLPLNGMEEEQQLISRTEDSSSSFTSVASFRISGRMARTGSELFDSDDLDLGMPRRPPLGPFCLCSRGEGLEVRNFLQLSEISKFSAIFRNLPRFSRNCCLFVPLPCVLVPWVSPVQRCCSLRLREVWLRHRNFFGNFRNLWQLDVTLPDRNSPTPAVLVPESRHLHVPPLVMPLPVRSCLNWSATWGVGFFSPGSIGLIQANSQRLKTVLPEQVGRVPRHCPALGHRVRG